MQTPSIACLCGEICYVRTSNTPKNPGRLFYSCPKTSDRCKFFAWLDELQNSYNASKRKAESPPVSAPPPISIPSPQIDESTPIEGRLAAKEKLLNEALEKLALLVQQNEKQERRVKKHKKEATNAKNELQKAQQELQNARRTVETAKKEAEIAKQSTHHYEKTINLLSEDIESLKRFQPENATPNPKRDADLLSCKICFDHPIQQIFYPCRHAILCQGCTEKTMEERKTCPLCRSKIHSFGRLYLAE
jgi:hypothetical protein